MGIELGRPVYAVAAIGVILSLGGLVIGGAPGGLGVAIGATLATLNFWAFTRVGTAMFSQGRGAAWGLVGAVKLVILFAVAFAVLKTDLASPLAFLIGYLALPIGIVASQLLGLPHDFENGEGSL